MRLFFTLLFALSYLSGNAQYKERPATLITRNEETLQGSVRDYDWNQNPRSVLFTAQKTGQAQTIPVRTIKRLTITEGPVYEGLYLKVPHYPTVAIPISSNFIQRIDSSYYFAELLLNSEPVKLYSFFDVDDKQRFVIDKYDSLVVLNDINVQLEKQGKVFSYALPEYRKTLKTVLSECPTLNTGTTPYTESGLIALLKEYLTFCRIDSKIYSEQTKPGKAIVGVGAFGSFLRYDDRNVSSYGALVQILFPRQFHNVFILADVGRTDDAGRININGSTSSDFPKTALGLYAGRYFGRRTIQGKLYTGISTMLGPLDTGAGISYRKLISAEIRYPVIGALFYNSGQPAFPPVFNLRAIIPLGKRGRY